MNLKKVDRSIREVRMNESEMKSSFRRSRIIHVFIEWMTIYFPSNQQSSSLLIKVERMGSHWLIF